jgi:poly(A) polymerase
MTTRKHDAKAAAMYVADKLRQAGYVALFAGGCVRDMLLGHEPMDYDLATDATPPRVKKLFPKARQVGAQFGVVLVRKYRHDVEVATFRTDGDYSDGRHPDAVTFRSREEDAKRRDFTINGMFCDPLTEQVIDDVDGQDDLKNKIIRTIGRPEDRFAEDHLRMLRAIRFAARLSFTIEPATLAAINKLAHKLQVISAERVYMELVQLMTAPSRASAWLLLVKTGLRAHLSAVWPADEDSDAVAMRRLEVLPPYRIDESLAMAALLPRGATGLASAVCHSLKMSNRLRGAIAWLVRFLALVREDKIKELADLKLLMAHDEWLNLLELLRVDEIADESESRQHAPLIQRAGAIPPTEVAPPPLLSGDDLLEMGVRQGPKFGRILRAVYRAQLNRAISTPEEAVALAREMME